MYEESKVAKEGEQWLSTFEHEPCLQHLEILRERCDAETWDELIVFSRRRRKREGEEKAGVP